MRVAQAAFQFLMLEHLDSLADASAKAISNIKFDKVVVWECGGSGSSTASFLQNMARMMPPMLQVMKDVGGVEIPEFLAKLEPDASAAPPPTPAETNGQPASATRA